MGAGIRNLARARGKGTILRILDKGPASGGTQPIGGSMSIARLSRCRVPTCSLDIVHVGSSRVAGWRYF